MTSSKINKVSQAIGSQSPDFIKGEYPLFTKFLEYYYKSQEKTGLGQNILNNFLQYLDIDKLDIGILDGKTIRDTSGNGNKGILLGDYSIKKTELGKVSKRDSYIKTSKTGTKNGAF